MATTKDYLDFVCTQLEGIRGVDYKRMFGEYQIYVNDKPVLLVCDISETAYRFSVLRMGSSSISIRKWQYRGRTKYTYGPQIRRSIAFPISHTPADRWPQP